MKSVFILATATMLMLTGCGSNSDGAFGTSSNVVESSGSVSTEVVGSTGDKVIGATAEEYVRTLSIGEKFGAPPGRPN